ncbi:3-oxoacyl-[acyl-carrier-protein] synthase III C-terminal domain-containing protein [Streptomyces sp. NPDC012421]|uniref:3-oxoacyl-[acyl-carrier-protein] synthase III C-terminal domain-containing protein n=1 Tax=Streptomyces sp. NPDC012421 TaxID=3364832 RepID=UPI0036EE3EFA
MGIVAVGTAFGEPCDVRETAAEYLADPGVAEKMGYDTYYRLREGDTPTALAARAAREALEDADLDVDDLDLLIVGVSDIPEYLGWDTSAAVARALGARTVPTVQFTQSCAAWSPALDHAAGAMALSPDTDTVLLVLVNVLSEAHANRMDFNATIASDGAVAAVLRRDHPRLRRLSSAHLTNSAYADLFRIEYGGATAPVAPEGEGNLDVDPKIAVFRHFDRDPARFEEFEQEIRARLAGVVDTALVRAGRERHEIARLVFINDNQRAVQEAGEAIGLPVERTNADLARELGHMGAADQLVCLWRHVEAGELAKGDLVALAGISAPGMHWFCTLIEV